ncbi:hypothetical protein FQA39_LY06416 [Lamprigera yunnana]|nr:hypothetical protein FQA39_LY06416 [Lamprigera yunnana]
MSDSDESVYIPNQEFESDMSDSDEEFSDSESEDNFIEPRFFGDWKVVSDQFIDSRDTDLFQQDYSYEIHPAIVPTDMNSPKDCFEAFVSPKIVRDLCSWTYIRAMMYFEEKHNYEMKVKISIPISRNKWGSPCLPQIELEKTLEEAVVHFSDSDDELEDEENAEKADKQFQFSFKTTSEVKEEEQLQNKALERK